MKKLVLTLIGILLITGFMGVAEAKIAKTNAVTSQAIKLYKSGNYTEAYLALKNIVAKDNSNALAYYYLGMTSVRLGKQSEAISNYDKAIDLSPNGVLGSYAKKGKRCIVDPTRCNEKDVSNSGDTEEDRFIKGSFGSGFSNEARGIYEKQKIENLKRDINRQEEIAPQRFREYKDFSSQGPSNDEIVSALRTLQRAGLSDVVGKNSSNYDILNTFLGNRNNSAQLSPQIIQSLLTTQMTTNF